MPNDCPTYEFTQTLFLGCSIQRFAANLGFNEQATTVNVTLVRDTCTGEKVYYNPDPVPYTGADPGFNIYGESGTDPPEIGAPVFFKFGDFEFCGLIQTWQQVEPASDTEIYEVTLASPVELLQGTNFILGDYAGLVKGFNIFNVYGFLEWAYGNPGTTFTQSSADGVLFGSVAEGFGGADATEAGISWDKVRSAISILTSSIPIANSGAVEAFSQYGRVCFVGAARGGYGLIGYDSINVTAGGAFAYAKHIAEYYLDLSSLPFSITDLRIPGSTADLLTIINQVCQELAHDYYVELKLVRINGIISKVIKIRPISRQYQPNLGIVQNFIEGLNEGGVIASSFGRELRNEGTTNFIIGGQKRSIYQVTNGVPIPGLDPDIAWLNSNFPDNNYVRDTVVPYYGKDSSGNVFVVDDSGFIATSSDGLKQSLTAIGSAMPATIKISLNEIKYAGAGFGEFTSALVGPDYSSPTHNGRLGKVIATFSPEYRGKYSRLYNMPGSINGKTKVRDFVDTINLQYNDEISQDIRKIYEFVYKMYETSQSHIMVRLPYVNVKRILTSEGTSSEILGGRLVTSDRPVEGGWTEQTNVIGLANPGSIIDYFKNDDGTIHSFASFLFDDGLNTESIPEGVKYFFQEVNPGDYVLFAEVQPLEELVFLDNQNAKSPRVIVQIPNLNQAAGFDRNQQFSANAAALGLNILEGNVTPDVEKELWKVATKENILEPYQLAIAFESNENTYGPWKPDNIIEAGPPGRINIQKDDSLVPWTYGSYSNMSLVAQAKTNESVGGMQAAENGSITIDGIPVVLLGSELAYSSATDLFDLLTTETQTVAITTEFQTLSYNVPYISRAIWTGSNGPNVNSINTQIGEQGITTTYEFRTFSPKFGTLSKYNANQLSQRLLKENRIQSRQRFLSGISKVQTANAKRLSPLSGKTGGQKKGVGSEGNADPDATTKPPAVLVGEFSPFRKEDTSEETAPQALINNKKGRKRTIVAAKPITSLGEDTSNSGYDNKAFLSWDGFFRPVSLTGSGGLPRMIKAINQDTYDTGSDNNIITNKYLNFLSNPIGYGNDELDYLHTGDDGGHDIEVVGRSSYQHFINELTGTGTGNSSSMVVPTNVQNNEIVDGYDDDYRFLALRGPLWMQSWGFDTDGKPVPNEADNIDSMSSGDYATENLTNRFYPNWLKKPQTWPVAPLDIRLNRERGVWEAGSASGGTSAKLVLVCEDLPGYSFDGLDATTSVVRALERSFNNSTKKLEINDEDDFIEVYPSEHVRVYMDNSSGCGSGDIGGGPILGGLYINMPIGGDNRLTDSEAAALNISGAGVIASSTVKIYINDVELVGSITVNDDGSWSRDSAVDLSGESRGIIKISAEETFLDTTIQAKRHIAVYYAKGYSSANLNYYVTQKPSRPALATSSDTGISSTDNITANDQPYIEHILTAVPDGAFNLDVYIDGVYDSTILATDPELSDLTDAGDVCSFQIAGTLSAGQHTIQIEEWYDDAVDGSVGQPTQVGGPMSDVLYVVYDPDEDGVADVGSSDSGELYAKTGEVQVIDGVNFLVNIGPCPIQLNTYVSDRINNYITATCIASTDFDLEDSSVDYDIGTFIIVNPTDDDDPDAPLAVSLIGSILTGETGDKIRLRYYNGSWEIRSVKSI